MKYLQQLASLGQDYAKVWQHELAAHPELWNQHRLRTEFAGTPHAVDDIWVRYRAWEEWKAIKLAHQHKPLHVMQTIGDTTHVQQRRYNENLAVAQFVGEEHESVWYPAADHLPRLKDFIFEAMRYFEAERLGGVLITRIPPGGEVKPHVDRGWHAEFFSKIALQIKSAPGQAFCFEDGEFECEPGTVYSFCNQQPHWVVNRSAEERITAIICIRTDQRKAPLWQPAVAT